MRVLESDEYDWSLNLGLKPSGSNPKFDSMRNVVASQGSSVKKQLIDNRILLIASCLLLFTCLLCGILFASGGIITYFQFRDSLADIPEEVAPIDEVNVPPLIITEKPSQPEPQVEESLSLESTSESEADLSLTPLVTPRPSNKVSEPTIQLNNSQDNLVALLDAEYPSRDYFENAVRLGKVDVGPRTVGPFHFELGDIKTFYSDNGEREAELLAITENINFWVETSLELNEEIVASAASRFEKEYYPGLREIFGTEWRPGIDNDSRFSVLHLDGYGKNTDLGFFNSGDEYPKSINEHSNEQEIIYLNMKNLIIGEDLYFGTLIHEYIHLIQWNADSNEAVWLSEGLAQFAELYTGLYTADSEIDFWPNPDIQLNSWEYDDEDKLFAHYGAAYLFVVYFWEQLGNEAIRELSSNQANGIAAIRQVLAKYKPETTLERFVTNWVVANYLDNNDAEDPYYYSSLELQRPVHTQEITSLPADVEGSVNQFAADYIQLKPGREALVHFNGDTQIDLFQNNADNDKVWYVPALDELDATLQAEVNLERSEDPVLSFRAWFELEADYDFAYISISSDSGLSWELLTPANGVTGEFGPALGGNSAMNLNNQGGWINEQISLRDYAGKRVILRFEVLTDSANPGAGFALDDILVSARHGDSSILLLEDEWQANGFVRTGHFVAQQWQIRLISFSSPNRITELPLDELNKGIWQLDLGNEGGVLVITALTPFVSKPANYILEIK